MATAVQAQRDGLWADFVHLRRGEVVGYEVLDDEVRSGCAFGTRGRAAVPPRHGGGIRRHPENVLMHLRNVLSGKELDAEATTKDLLVVRKDGRRQVRRYIRHCNLDAVISETAA